MRKEDVIKQLERIFNAIDRYNDKRYYDFIIEYEIFICEEKTYIPKIIQKLYRIGKVTKEDLMILAMTYSVFANHYHQDEKLRFPTFLTKDFNKETNLLKNIRSFAKKEIADSKEREQKGIPILDKKPTKNDIVFDYEKLHIQILNELYKDEDKKIPIADSTVQNTIKFNTKTGKYQVNNNQIQNIGINSYEYKVLKAFAEENNPLSFAQILEHNDSDMRNEITKLLRKRTGLTKEHIINKAGFISLSGVSIINSDF